MLTDHKTHRKLTHRKHTLTSKRTKLTTHTAAATYATLQLSQHSYNTLTTLSQHRYPTVATDRLRVVGGGGGGGGNSEGGGGGWALNLVLLLLIAAAGYILVGQISASGDNRMKYH